MTILNGNFSDFNLSQLLRILYSSKVTGILHLTRRDEKTKIYLQNGKPVGVENKRQDPLEDLIEASTWMDGDFNFETVPEENIIRNITIPPDQLILLLAKKEKEFKELKESLPPLDSILVMNPTVQDEEIRLQPDEWNFLFKIDGKKTLDELTRSVDLGELEVFSMVIKMFQKGILKVVEPEKGEGTQEPVIPTEDAADTRNILSEKLEDLENIFMRYVGPMGAIIIDEIMESLNLNRNTVSQSELPKLVEKMSMEIESDSEKRQFEEEVLKSLNPEENVNS